MSVERLQTIFYKHISYMSMLQSDMFHTAYFFIFIMYVIKVNMSLCLRKRRFFKDFRRVWSLVYGGYVTLTLVKTTDLH